MTVTLTDLTGFAKQGSLFEEQPPEEQWTRNRSRRLAVALDQLHQRFGEQAVRYGRTQQMSSGFVHLHTHSSYSPIWGIPTLEALCQAAQTQGQDRLALTDTNGVYGTIRFLEVAQHRGLKPILGAELVHGTQRAVLLAKTPAGYANLCRLLSARHEESAFDFITAVARYRAGLIILSDDLSALRT